jgi:hypothetical protein
MSTGNIMAVLRHPGVLDLTGLEILANQHSFTDLMSGPLKSSLHKNYSLCSHFK